MIQALGDKIKEKVSVFLTLNKKETKVNDDYIYNVMLYSIIIKLWTFIFVSFIHCYIISMFQYII